MSKSSGCRYRLAKSGDSTAPWGVPVVGCQRATSDMISCCRKQSIRAKTRLSLIEPSTNAISRSCGMVSKHATGLDPVVTLQVGVHHMGVTFLQQAIDFPQRILATPSRPEAVASRPELNLKACPWAGKARPEGPAR